VTCNVRFVGRLLLVLTLIGPLADKPATAGQRETVEKILNDFRTRSGFPGAIVGVYFPNGTSISLASGFADRAAKIPMRSDALLHAGSVGKTLFAACVMQLVAERRVGLDAKLEDYLGTEAWFPRLPNSKSVTIRMLLNHTSGIGSYGEGFMQGLVKDPGRKRDHFEGIKSVLDSKPLFPAGGGWSYSDVNYLLLGLVIERVSKQTAYAEIEARLLRPLHLRRIVPADRPTIPGLVPGYAGSKNPFGGDEVMKAGSLVLDPNFEWASGGFVANAEDLAVWMADFCNGRAFDRALLPQVLDGVPAPDLGARARYGLGLEIDETPIGVAYGHGGFFPGYVTWVRWYPKQRMAVAIQLNTSEDALITTPIRDVLDQIIVSLSR
jgi:D-alanyl-D-alanine carboxypeptidase